MAPNDEVTTRRESAAGQEWKSHIPEIHLNNFPPKLPDAMLKSASANGSPAVDVSTAYWQKKHDAERKPWLRDERAALLIHDTAAKASYRDDPKAARKALRNMYAGDAKASKIPPAENLP